MRNLNMPRSYFERLKPMKASGQDYMPTGSAKTIQFAFLSHDPPAQVYPYHSLRCSQYTQSAPSTGPVAGCLSSTS